MVFFCIYDFFIGWFVITLHYLIDCEMKARNTHISRKKKKLVNALQMHYSAEFISRRMTYAEVA